jgi:hypothetical protein
LFRKLLAEPAPRNALIELENKLAESSDVQQVGLEDIHNWNVKYKTDLHLKFGNELDLLHESFLRFCLVDDSFSEAEVAQAFHLQKLFGLSDIKHNEIYFRVAEDVYKRNLLKLLADGNISEEKRRCFNHSQVNWRCLKMSRLASIKPELSS